MSASPQIIACPPVTKTENEEATCDSLHLIRQAGLTPNAAMELLALLLCQSAREINATLKAAGISTMGRRVAITNAILKEQQRGDAHSHTPSPLTANVADAESSCGTDHQPYRVIHKPCVYLREHPSTNANRVGTVWAGDTILASVRAEDGWLKLTQRSGWILRDGASLGLGQLVEPLER